MTLPAVPPKFSSWAAMAAPIIQGEHGWRPYALQQALNATGSRLQPDGIFGPATAADLRAYQRGHGLDVDAIAGPATQQTLITQIGTRVHAQLAGIPAGLMRGFAEGEGANLLAAVNWTIPGGVDCGVMQQRVLGPPYSAAAMNGAFNPLVAMLTSAGIMLERADAYARRSWASASRERALRCAVLAHNWPAAADQVARDGSVPRGGDVATWVPAGTRFPDGAAVRTRREWCEYYALAGSHGEGRITKYVTTWPH